MTKLSLTQKLGVGLALSGTLALGSCGREERYTKEETTNSKSLQEKEVEKFYGKWKATTVIYYMNDKEIERRENGKGVYFDLRFNIEKGKIAIENWISINNVPKNNSTYYKYPVLKSLEDNKATFKVKNNNGIMVEGLHLTLDEKAQSIEIDFPAINFPNEERGSDKKYIAISEERLLRDQIAREKSIERFYGKWNIEEMVVYSHGKELKKINKRSKPNMNIRCEIKKDEIVIEQGDENRKDQTDYLKIQKKLSFESINGDEAIFEMVNGRGNFVEGLHLILNEKNNSLELDFLQINPELDLKAGQRYTATR